MGKMYHLDVGCADASIIVTASATFLVDCHDIHRHANLLPSSRHLRGVFITHQHHDHYSGLGYLRNNAFSIEHLIYSPYERRYGDSSVTQEEWAEFNDHKDFFAKKGTKLHAPFRQDKFDRAWWSTDGVDFWLIGPAPHIARSATRVIHDACLVFTMKSKPTQSLSQAALGVQPTNGRTCAFTGDASDTNLKYVAGNTQHFCGDILHASHHGSIEGADESFIEKSNPNYCVISTATGVHQNVPHPTALARYDRHTRDKVFRTDKGGTIEWNI